MYIRNDEAGIHGFGLAPAAVKAALEIGSAIVTIGSVATTANGSFQTSTTPITYEHEGTAMTRPFRTCKRQFMISAFRAAGFPIPPSHPNAPAEKFWFELEFGYNGNDLKAVRVDPQYNKSSTLYKSKFAIAFVPEKASVEKDPVAAVRFLISGSWELWDLPFNTVVSFKGALNVRADGTCAIQMTSEKGWVNVRTMNDACPILAPLLPRVEVPKVPIPQLLQFTVNFRPAGSHRLTEADGQRIVDWFERLPAATKTKISVGALPIVLEGHASTTQSKRANQELSLRRAAEVQRILKGMAGSAAQFRVHAYGEYKAGTPDSVEAPSERRVRISVTDFTFQ